MDSKNKPAPTLLCTELSSLGYMSSHDIIYIIRFKVLKLH